MSAQNTIRGALASFLDIVTSRYSAHAGYLLFRILVRDRDRLEIDLLESPTIGWVLRPSSRVGELTRAKFAEQTRKAGVDVSDLSRAVLVIRRGASSEGMVNGRRVRGFDLHFSVKATSRAGKTYESERVVFAAPVQFPK